MRHIFLLIFLFMAHAINAQHKRMLALNRPSSSVFASNPYAVLIKTLSISMIIGYVIFYYFIGPIGPVLMSSKPPQSGFGLVRRE